MTYQEALKYLNSFINYEKQDNYDYVASFKLDRMRQMASLLGDPQREIRSIHIAGTKGKGSTSAMVYSILKSAGFKVGLYTSPHLVSFRERIRINDSFISEEDVSRLLDGMKEVIGRMNDNAPSFFEVYTALAYLYFKEKAVDFAVYEVGLGGRLDATNIIEPLVCAITPISYEHTQKLGNALREIASEKAGIIKDNGICVMAPQEKESRDAIEKICKEKRARLISVGRDILFEELDHDDKREVFNIFGVFSDYPMLEMSLLGSHQVINAATAIGVVEALRFYNMLIPFDAIRNGIAQARWEGRLEVVSRRPLIVLDGAQNRASANVLVKSVKRTFKYQNLILVFGVSKDKDVKGILEEVLPIAGSIILTKSKVVERALDPSKIKEFMDPNDIDVVLSSSVEDALEVASLKAGQDDLILVTGSLFIVGEARNILVNKNEGAIV